MKKLSQDILTFIYSFDDTYKKRFALCMKQMILLFKKYIIRCFIHDMKYNNIKYNHTFDFHHNNIIYCLYCIKEMDDNGYNIVGTRSFTKEGSCMVMRCEYIDAIIHVDCLWNVTLLFS